MNYPEKRHPRATRRWPLLALLLSRMAFAQDDLPIHVYPAPRAEVAPVIDGRLDDAVWSQAPLVSGFVWYDRLEPLAVQTSFGVCWDSTALYFGVRCDEPAMAKLTPLPVPHDAHQVFGTEAIEIFFDPGHDHRLYYQWAVNAAASLYDSRLTEPAFQSGATAATQTDATGWTLEIRMPWQPLEVTPAAGQVHGFNVCRDRTLLNAREWSCWAPVKANFHDPERFAHLVLSPTPSQLAELGAEFRMGGRSGPLRIFSREGVDGQSWLGLAEAAYRRVELALVDLARIAASEAPAVGLALTGRLAEIEQQMTDLRRAIRPGLDGATFTRTELALSKLEQELGALIWQARLEALLAGI